jgi:hypothetical protein
VGRTLVDGGIGPRRALIAASTATGLAAAVTAANRLGDVPTASLAATPQAVADGRVWLILSSGVVADRPTVPSLVGFWAVGLAMLLLASGRLACAVALAGQTLSALAVYAVIGIGRAVDAHTFTGIVRQADYGLSAMIAAWLGAIASVLWVRYPARSAHGAIALGSLGCAGIGLALKPSVTFLDSEHLLAFAIGAVLIDARARRSLAGSPRRLAAATASVLFAARP